MIKGYRKVRVANIPDYEKAKSDFAQMVAEEKAVLTPEDIKGNGMTTKDIYASKVNFGDMHFSYLSQLSQRMNEKFMTEKVNEASKLLAKVSKQLDDKKVSQHEDIAML